MLIKVNENERVILQLKEHLSKVEKTNETKFKESVDQKIKLDQNERDLVQLQFQLEQDRNQ